MCSVWPEFSEVMWRLFFIWTSFVLTACGETPRTPDEAQNVILSAKDKVEAAIASNDVEKSVAIAADARACLEQLNGVQPALPPPRMDELRKLALEAGSMASLASEKKNRGDKLAGWKVRAFRAAETTVMKTLFLGMALAADQAGKERLDLLPETVRKAALEGARWVESLCGLPADAPGGPDWIRVAEELRKIAEKPPANLRLLITLVLLLKTDFDLALAEIESVNPEEVQDQGNRCLAHAFYGLVYLSQGWPLLGAAQFDQAQQLSKTSEFSRETACTVQLLLMIAYMREQRWEEADRALAAASRAWPDNPLTTYLTGERLLADGRREEAEESFEKALAGSGGEQLAKHVAERLKYIREHPEDTHARLLDMNSLTRLLWGMVEDRAKDSDVFRRMSEQKQRAEALLDDLKKKLPDLPDLGESGRKLQEWWK
ncbi:MAG: hypothetical protein RLZZ476_1690 [Verrucomicrobiota bacterium]